MVTAASTNAGHPSPERHRVTTGPLIFGLCAGPAAWAVASMASVTIAQEACYPGSTPLSAPAFGGAQVMIAALHAIACVVAIAGGVVAYQSWRQTSHEHKGSSQTLLEVGEGRARFMAMAGILTSAGFLIAILFNVAAVVLGRVC
jgi:hypothetical protein